MASDDWLFVPVDVGLPQLTAYVASTDAALEIPPPPPIRDIGETLRIAYRQTRAGNYASLRRSQIRRLPYAYWLPGKPALPEVEPELVSRYWKHELWNAVTSNPRRGGRWLKPLFYTYCEAFTADRTDFRKFSMYIAGVLERASGAVATHMRTLQNELRFFEPDEVPRRLAKEILGSDKSAAEVLEDRQLWRALLDGDLGMTALSAALNTPVEQRRRFEIVRQLLRWLQDLSIRIEKTTFRIATANALLLPWSGQGASDEVRHDLMSFFLERYGDPRLRERHGDHWRDVDPKAEAVLLRWLVGDTLRGFIQILKATADDTWQYREKFWMAYYNRGFIEEAWLALGPNAKRHAVGRTGSGLGSTYGALTSAADKKQSVLLLRIGDLTFTEWSHNGSLRAFDSTSRRAPGFYESTYDAGSLREMRSLDFHHGQNENPQLTHAHSANGTWQRKARDFIRQRTGVHLDDKEIM